MAEIDVLGQEMDVERVTSNLKSGFQLKADVYVTDYRGDEHHGVVDKDVKAILINTTREDEHVSLSRSDLTADVVAEVLEGAKELIADFPDYYMDDADDIAASFGKYDVRLESARIEEQAIVREITAENAGEQ